MNLPFLIAKRYFFSTKKKSFINFISIISMLGVGIGTMALVIVLSVFNGLEDLNRQIFKTHDPDLKISPKTGKNFELDNAKLAKVNQISEVAFVNDIIQDNALAKYGDAQMVVTIKGVNQGFEQNGKLKDALVEGKMILNKDSVNYAFIGGGVFATLNVSLDNIIQPLELWYPRNTKKVTLNPEEAINSLAINISGVYSLDEQHDYYVYVPLSVAQTLTEYENKRTAIEVEVKNDDDIEKVQNKLKEIFGDNFLVQNQDEQNASLYRAIKIEKLFIFIALILIVGVAAFNIFFSLTLLTIDKQDDIKTLLSMGAESSLIRKVFFTEGAIISLSGAIIGLILGGLICWAQETYGFVKMGMESAIVDSYPVKMQLSDFLITAFALILITLIASYLPSKRASEIKILKR
ncbi:MAG: ABC transporter permease [Spirosomataceae bacterium]